MLLASDLLQCVKQRGCMLEIRSAGLEFSIHFLAIRCSLGNIKEAARDG